MADEFPEAAVRTGKQKRDGDLHLAPGEGRMPTNFMREPHFDIDGFPHLLPSGRFGLNYERKHKLTPQQYFDQRLQNEDSRFSKSSSYTFAALNFVERHQMEQKINVSCQRGKLQGGTFAESDDPMNVFEDIKGTPKYWKKVRYDIIAKVEQLGPFQFFFTLSCADKRWMENIESILFDEGHDITIEKTGSTDNIEDGQTTVLVDGIPLETFMEKEGFNKNKLLQDNILTITKVFDKKVHKFITAIVKGKNSPVNCKYFHYRIEFQSRGAGHAHGVLWLDLEYLEEEYQGITNIFRSLKVKALFDDQQLQTLKRFIDNFISCSLTVTDENFKCIESIVKEVQVHHHTKTCQKYKTKCRFGYPKLPSEETIIAQPLNKEDFNSEKDYKSKLLQLENTLKQVKEVLSEMDDLFHSKVEDDHKKLKEIQNKGLDDIWRRAKVTRKEYYEALRVTKKGKVIILKRNLEELWVNNYNPEWIRAWNGNMDVQICLDFFAIVTYITGLATRFFYFLFML